MRRIIVLIFFLFVITSPAWSAWSLEQSNSGSGGSVTFDSTPDVNNLIVVGFTSWGQDPAADEISDNQGNSYTQVHEVNFDTSGYVATYYAIASTSSGSFTIDTNYIASDFTLAIHEFSGNATSSVLSQNNTNSGTGTAADSGNITASDGNTELFFGLMTHSGGDETLTEGSGWTEAEEMTDGTSYMPIHTQWKTSSGTDSSDSTIGSSENWGAVIASFEPPGGSPSTTPIKIGGWIK